MGGGDGCWKGAECVTWEDGRQSGRLIGGEVDGGD